MMLWDQPAYVYWMGAGLLLCILEMVIPGMYLIWIGCAALLTGILALLLPIGLPLALLCFAVFAIASIYASRRWTRSDAIASDDPLLNDRTGRMIGEVLTLVSAITDGQGRARVGDGEWTVLGPDLPAGAKVRVIGAQGTLLLVEAVG